MSFPRRPSSDSATCPDNEWRLIVVLARYAGLRIPSELEELTWERIDWEHNRFTKKKEHIDGHGTRVVPIFPEIRPYLEQAWAEAPSGAMYVVPRGRTGNVNLRTGLERGRGTRCGSRRPGTVTCIKNSGPNSGQRSAVQMQS